PRRQQALPERHGGGHRPGLRRAQRQRPGAEHAAAHARRLVRVGRLPLGIEMQRAHPVRRADDDGVGGGGRHGAQMRHQPHPPLQEQQQRQQAEQRSGVAHHPAPWLAAARNLVMGESFGRRGPRRAAPPAHSGWKLAMRSNSALRFTSASI
ncbi:hypothetical protein HMPREF0731_2514, partial [Pseudoroseomonas cervicalis ATCC 49957]